MLGADRLAYWGRQYGFGKPTGIDLPGEVSGIVPSNQWKVDTFGTEMFGGEVYQSGIGQGYDVVTPIQLINAYAALANGGKLYRPQIVRDVIGPDGTVVQPFKPDLIRKLDVPGSVLRDMRLAGRATVTLRHTYNLVDMPVKVAGKSGTAEFGHARQQGPAAVPLLVRRLRRARTRTRRTSRRPDSELVFLAFAYDSRTEGQRGHRDRQGVPAVPLPHPEGLPNRDLMKRGNFYGAD